jgi:hypothetical protein
MSVNGNVPNSDYNDSMSYVIFSSFSGDMGLSIFDIFYEKNRNSKFWEV